MSNTFEVREVISFLKQRFVATSLEWVAACIDFIKQEHNGQQLTLNVLKDYVYQQWLTADLEEIGVPALSPDLSTTQKITLNGSFALQVNGVRDVGKSAYTQLKDLDKLRSRNDEFSSAAGEATVPAWEAKPTRMLMLNLTDGCTNVQGMEYKPINFLSVNLTAGLKVLIQGPVDCRFGVLLLTADKIKVLGGEVESKLQQYSQKTILRDLLHLPSEDDVLEENTDANEVPAINNEEQNLVSAPVVSRSISSRQTTITSAFGHQSANTRPLANSSHLNSNQNYGPTRNCPGNGNQNVQVQNQNEFDDLDDFENDDDFTQSLDYGLIDELERENSISQIEEIPEEENIWNEDEDILQDIMEFQEQNPVLEIPFHVPENQVQNKEQSQINKSLPYTYLSSMLEKELTQCSITIKGFIMKVLSKLECTVDKGWSLCVKINDGSATLDANLHDKVLENIIGVSAAEMVKMQKQAVQDADLRIKVKEAISKCKTTLQDYSCLMDIEFSPDCKPCIIKFRPIS